MSTIVFSRGVKVMPSWSTALEVSNLYTDGKCAPAFPSGVRPRSSGKFSRMTFEHQIDEFAKDHTVILPTIRGYPPSDVPVDEDSYDGNVMAGDLLALKDHLHFEKAIFAGRDYSLKYIEHNPDDAYDVDHVVRTIPDPKHRAKIKQYLQESPEDGVFYFFRKNFPGPPYGQNVDTSTMHYKMPSVVIWGLQEPDFSDKMLDGFYKWFDQSVRVVTLPNAGHWLWLEDPVKVNRELRSWLAALESGQL